MINLDDKGQYTINNIQENKIITVEKFKDQISPSVKIKIGENEWSRFKYVISYGKYFFSKTQTAVITATDGESGIDKCYYAIDDSGNDVNNPTETMSQLR